MKRANGTGTIFKNNQSGKWCVKVTVGWVDGKQKTKQIGSFRTKREATQCLNNFTSINNYDYSQNKFGDIINEWFKTYKESHSQKSLKSYETVLKSFTPLNDIKVCNMNYQQLQQFADTVTANECHVKTILHSVFKEIQKNISITDYSRLITFPNVRHNQKEKHIFSNEDINLLWANNNSMIFDITLILLYSGLRIQELLNLENKNIHLDENYMVGGLKTEAGKNRIIPIHKKIKPIIEKYFNINNKFIFCHFNSNKQWQYITIYKMFASQILPLVTEGVTIHSTRHTFTTGLSRAGVDIYTIKRIIGHSIGDITEGVYIHNDRNELTQAVNKLDYLT